MKHKWICFLQNLKNCTLRNLVHFETFRIVLCSVGCVMYLETLCKENLEICLTVKEAESCSYALRQDDFHYTYRLKNDTVHTIYFIMMVLVRS